MATKEQLQDMVEALTTLNTRILDEDERNEAEYIVNDIIIPKAKPPKTQKSNNPGKENVEYKIINIKKIKIEKK